MFTYITFPTGFIGSVVKYLIEMISKCRTRRCNTLRFYYRKHEYTGVMNDATRRIFVSIISSLDSHWQSAGYFVLTLNTT